MTGPMSTCCRSALVRMRLDFPLAAALAPNLKPLAAEPHLKRLGEGSHFRPSEAAPTRRQSVEELLPRRLAAARYPRPSVAARSRTRIRLTPSRIRRPEIGRAHV